MTMTQLESGRGTTDWKFERFDAEQAAWVTRTTGIAEPRRGLFRECRVRPYSVTEHHGNVITNAGWQAALASATGSGSPLFTSTHGRLGVGTSTTAATAADTTLGTPTLFKFMAAAPSVGSGTNRTWTFVATFASGDANVHWQEFGLDTGTTDGSTVSGTFYNHAVSDQSTKVSGQVWTATATVSFT
jgi:hypothetical protein